MSVCFVSADAPGSEEGGEGGLQLEEDSQGANGEAHFALAQFWERVMEDIRKVNSDDFKQQVLPLARVKKIMKLDEDVKMISAEAPLLFAKAAEIFIHELTLRAWVHTEDNKRRTLQRNDIAMAIIKSDQFDFLIDIVPRQDLPKPAKTREEPTTRTAISQDQVHYYFQLAQQHQAALQTPQSVTTQIHQSQGGAPSTAAQVVQVQAPTQQPALQIVQQVVSPGGEIQQIPLQLTPHQLNVIRMQMQNGGGQPIIIQAAPMPSAQSQLIQVSQQQQPQQVYLTQVATSQEGE